MFNTGDHLCITPPISCMVCSSISIRCLSIINTQSISIILHRIRWRILVLVLSTYFNKLCRSYK
ncbi:hypothetical protein HanIR_Chr14g0707301 [Helianthus annuus]|nr:hypothetical protein HanIR_Chr14g0707301 [Helianthus annuus]